jgi:aspartyl protease family protein
MDLRLLAPLFALALAIGWFFPQGENGDEAAPQQVAAATSAAPSSPTFDLSDEDVGGGQDPVILDRKPDGHFYATADISGTPVRFLVDTGASMIALTGDDARALGFSWDSSELMHVGRGVNGDVMGKPVMLDSVAIGDVEFGNMRAVIIPNGLDISLLGQSFLERVDNVRIERDRMTIGG